MTALSSAESCICRRSSPSSLVSGHASRMWFVYCGSPYEHLSYNVIISLWKFQQQTDLVLAGREQQRSSGLGHFTIWRTSQDRRFLLVPRLPLLRILQRSLYCCEYRRERHPRPAVSFQLWLLWVRGSEFVIGTHREFEIRRHHFRYLYRSTTTVQFCVECHHSALVM